MKTYNRIVPAHLRFLVAVHVLLLVIYSVFRSVTLLYNRPSWLFQVDHTVSLSEAFRIGFAFDVTVASYALLIPYLVLTTAYMFQLHDRRLFAFVRIFCGAVVLVSLIICIADVPYFNFFNNRLNSATIHWKNNSIVARFLLTNIKYYPFLFLLGFGVWGISKLMRTIWNKTWSSAEGASYKHKLLSSGLATLLLLVGLWGGATPKAPNMKEAYFSNDGFINQLTLNPVHTLFDSYFDFDINIFKIDQAKSKVQQYLGIKNNGKYESPIARLRKYPQGNHPKMNVVVILMESMTADRMGVFGNPNNLTPGLDSLAKNSVFFNHCFSNGIHTNAGLYSTLYGMPIMMMQHPMYNGVSEFGAFTGLPVTLRDMGYSTTFFCTHPKAFDNLDVFLPRNGYERISDLADYPASKIVNSWGVSDESLFEYALPQLDSLADTPDDKPFFATILTITTHPPFNLPAFTKFKPRSTDPIMATYEYSDWAIKGFMDACAKKDWYDNTIFVLVGDHGVNLPDAYQFDVPLSYNHVPLIIHAPGLFKTPTVRQQLANQTDIYPTVMGLLQQNYVQNTLGFDLFRENRPLAFFSQDQRLGVVNDNFLYVARKSGTEALYDYRSGSGEDISHLYPALVDSMRNYACAHLQVANWMIQNKQTGKQQ